MQVIRSSYHADFPTCTNTLGTDGVETTTRVCYCVDLAADRPVTGPGQIKIEASEIGPNPLPVLGDTYQFGNEFDLGIVATRIGPVEINPNNCNKAKICVDYSAPDNSNNDDNGNPAADPTEFRKEVSIDFISESMPGETFVFEGFCDKEGNRIELSNPVLPIGDVGPVRNSAGCPSVRNCLNYKHNIRVRTYFDQWNCDWQESFGRWNTAPVRIVEQDAFSILFDCTYPACTLQMLPAGKSLIEYEGRQYVCVDWNILYDPEGYEFRILDAGTQAAFAPGIADVTGVRSAGGSLLPISANDERLIHNPTGKRDLGVSEPVLLNGQGVEASVENLAGVKAPIFLHYTKEDSKFDFDLLPICTPIG